MKSVIDEVLVRLIEELNIEYPLYDGHSLVSQDDLREIIGEVYKLRKTADWARGEIDRLGNELKTQTETVQYLIGERTADRKHWGAIEDNLNRAERILAALREPSSAVVDAVYDMDLMIGWQTHKNIIRAAAAAAEQEVGRS